jgi:hypothetical protein
MARMSLGARGVRAVALLTAGALAVHELRMAVEGGDAGGAADSAVHRALPLLASVAFVLTALALAQFAVAAVRTHRERSEPAGPASVGRPATVGFAVLSSRIAGLVLAAHLAQQLAEGAAAGRPLAGFGAVGLLVAAAGAAAAGAVIAALLGGADRALVALRGGRDRAARRRRTHAQGARPAGPDLPSSPPLARHLAARAPPFAA